MAIGSRQRVTDVAGQLSRLARGLSPQFVKQIYRKLKPVTMQEAFSTVYREDTWDGGSGRGSTADNTVRYRALIEQFIRDNDVKSVVDLGCGDWQFSHLIDWGGASYIGLDVVPSVIEENRRRYGPRFEFRCFDASSEPLPAGDLLLLKDVLQHWPRQNIFEFIPKFDAFRFVMITNSTNGDPAGPAMNDEIALTGYRPLDLRLPPFNLPAQVLLDFQTDEVAPTEPPNKRVLLYRGRPRPTA